MYRKKYLKYLYKYNILKQRGGENITVTINSLNGEELVLVVTSDTKIIEIKKFIEKDWGISPIRQKLYSVKNEKALLSGQSVSDLSEDGVLEILLLIRADNLKSIPDNDTLRKLVDKWFNHNLTQQDYKKYGQPAQWKTNKITDMSYLFSNFDRQDFNWVSEHIGDWDISNINNNEKLKGCKRPNDCFEQFIKYAF